MSRYWAKNINWGQLLADNTVEVTFDVYDTDENVIATGVTTKGAMSDIQTLIADALKAKANAVDLYNAITQNTELAVEMAA